MKYISTILFVLLTYKPDGKELARLLKSLGNVPTTIIDNTKKNLGYAGGVTVGIKKALHDGVDWIVVINQDLHVTIEAIGNLVDVLSQNEIGVVGPFAGALDAKRWTTILPSKNVNYISGSCMVIHRAVFEKIGYFYEPYFMYYEDADFCVRAKNAGFPIVHLPLPGISHTDTTSLGRGSFLHQYYLARNHLLFVERNAPPGVKLHELVRLPKTIWEHCIRQEWGALAGIRDYFLRRFGQYMPLW